MMGNSFVRALNDDFRMWHEWHNSDTSMAKVTQQCDNSGKLTLITNTTLFWWAKY